MRPTSRVLGTLSAAALLLAACSGGTPTTAPTAAGATTAATLCTDVTQDAPATEVEASVADFTWAPVEAKVGQVITWKNNDTATHGVQTDDSGCRMDGSIPVNGTRSLVFNEPGTFTFFCFVHSSMKGSITIS